MRCLRWVALLVAAAFVACDSPSGPSLAPKQEAELRVARFPADLAALAQTSASFWAVKGENREVTLRYLDSSGSGSDRFLEFEVPADALLLRPDGTPFARGDSVLITVQVGTDRRMLFHFQPSGLRFNPAEPARLRVNYRRLNGDLDGDGQVTDADFRLERDARIWKQEQPGDPWFPLGTVKDLDAREFRARITSFSGFVIAA
ncbi:hypothetical protein BH23GEM9_BH23GEM9_13190 [soil metagenome]